VLELGGNGPQIVLADADIDKAADAAITGCFYLAGQCCTAAERILVHSSVQDAFVAALVERVAKLRVGDPLDDATDMGPLSTPATLERTKPHVADAVSKGRRWSQWWQRGPVPRTDRADRVTSDMRIAQEGRVGPVAPIMRFETLDEALEIAIETEFGLTAAVFANDLRASPARRRGLRHGNMHINETTNYWDQMAPVRRRQRSPAPAASWRAGSRMRHGDEADHVRTG
jgi:acyl-CoA reductase-like NAD-dependent aldehyde dehydrogenase